MKFSWRDRGAALRRVIVLVTCTENNIDQSIHAMLHTADKLPMGSAQFRYCNHPHLISEAVKGRLIADVAAAIADVNSKAFEKIMVRGEAGK